ncbi:TonB-linked outer membrane protein, SusC/RagA family [Chitinophaga terrae (ex Kim and Jung 2007)]|uniref:TonB-linked outer membrane protein, SusC/RagA family n=1 Tax=Chitinophaga terrae (ex Kim and Jung 2007) TaxID=408074 RepID=A0A1H4GG80_9BACT|nr:TonB-dependent receptor [Chitinophaga terrae (ex Kim and Jung 2007)]SEB08497.1 TonB-linked outer membrane protein, SusC/RagA family [Chitinophaga terrae (ex Kim and Jung 2007)]
MKRILQRIPVLVFLLFVHVAWSQQRTVTGKVTDESGSPVPGASVSAKLSKKAVAADAEGNFSITVLPDEKVLTISAISFATQEVPVGNGIVAVRLKQSDKELSEVVVVGYGTQKITQVSGAISTVKAEDIQRLKPVRIEEGLQGLTAGVNVIQSGSPGAKPTVLVRGIPSFSGVDPLVIIDGVQQTLDDLNALNPSDVESMNVLKDAATSAIYGIKGGNGVIVVTTRSGMKNQKPEINVNLNYGSQEVLKTIGVLNATEYAAMINEGSTAAGGNVIFPDLSKLGKGTNWQKEIFHNAPIQNYSVSARGGSDRITYFVSGSYVGQDGIVGGGDKSNFNRINGTANLAADITSKLKLLVNTSYANIKSQGIQENSFNSIIGSALNFDPTVPVYNDVPNTVGKYGFSNLLLSEIFNPLTKLDNTYNQSNGNKMWGKVELQYEVIKNLKLTTRFGYTNWDQIGKSFTPLVFYGPLNVENTMNADGSTVTIKNGLGQISSSAHNSVNEYKNSNSSYVSETFASYNFNIKEDHHFDAVLGLSLSRSNFYNMNVTAQDVPFNSWEFADVNAATGTNTAAVVYFRDTVINGVAMQVRDPRGDVAANLNGRTMGQSRGFRKNLSYFGRVNYDYKEKYLASISVRRDGSYAFPENKFADFVAGSVGWIISRENFWESEFFNYLKVRASYGSVGNENITPPIVKVVTGGPNYDDANNNGYTFGNTFVPGSTIASYANPIAGWEKQIQINAGFDVSFFQNKFSITADYYQKDVKGLLFKPLVSLYMGTAKVPDANIGSTRSRGVDISVGYTDRLSKDFSINTRVNVTTTNNLVTQTNSDNSFVLYGGNYFNGQSQNVTAFEAGKAPGYFFGFKTNGLFQTADEINKAPKQLGARPGDIRFVDMNGDGQITDADKTEIGNPFPKFTLGWNLTLNYRNFDFNVFAFASYGNDIYRAYERNANYTNKFRNILDRWTGPGSTNDAKNPRYSFTDDNNNARASDRYIEDGSFIKIKNIQLGYTFRQPFLKRAGFKDIRIYAQVKNAYTFTRYSGFDPEIAGGIMNTGVDRGAYPQSRVWALGLDFKL